jgi:hypothetical protein
VKKIIGLASLLFIFLMTVLPAGISHAAAKVPLSGISLDLGGGKTIKAANVGDNRFALDLVGDQNFGQVNIQSLQFKSNDSAVTISLLPSNIDPKEIAPFTKDDFDLQFVNGTAVLDSSKYLSWMKRITGKGTGVNIPDMFASTGNADNAFTIDSFKSGLVPMAASVSQLIQNPNLDKEPVSPYVLNFYLTDNKGNESLATLTVKTEGWKYQGNKWYYFDEFGDFQTGWYKDAGKWYFFDNNGVMKTGWVKDGGKWYYLNANGVMATGWAKVSGKWYYLDPVNGNMKTSWVKVSNKWYYFDASGAMKTGWVKVSNKWYYLDPASGAKKTGWLKVSNKWYYLDPVSGAMKTGWVKIANKWYYFYSDGHMK